MRSLLGFIVFTAALIAIGGMLLAPPLVGQIVAASVRDASPFGDQALEVEVDVDALDLVRGFVGEIRISGTDLAADGIEIGSLDVAVRMVGIGARDFTALDGRLSDVRVPLDVGPSVPVGEIKLSGPSTDVRATATLDAAAAAELVGSALSDVGIAVDGVELIDGGVAVSLGGRQADLGIVVVDGALVVPSFLGATSVSLISPKSGDPWRITAFSASPVGFDIEASVDAGALVPS
jgi:hypothetical protein